MKNKETLKFIIENIKGSKFKIFLLSLSQILIGILTVAFSFMLRYVINGIEVGVDTGDKSLLIKYTIIISCIAIALVGLQIFYRLYYEVSHIDIENKLKNTGGKINNDEILTLREQLLEIKSNDESIGAQLTLKK